MDRYYFFDHFDVYSYFSGLKYNSYEFASCNIFWSFEQTDTLFIPNQELTLDTD
jgi:hypothetical protein